ncbi:MAG: carbohydrate kinase family protein [Candidatus Thermoplasmatota archaeon]|nr:carbohydrate kinase family protein [Candidatus Thermoplasmatota archaeon]
MSYLGIFGHVVLDRILRVPRLPEPNTSIQVTETRECFGGTGGNIARAAARLGVEASLASFVGEDFPEEYRSALKADGVDLTDLKVVHGRNTPTAWIFSDPEGNQVAVIDQGSMAEISNMEVLEHTIRDSQVVHIATGKPDYYRKVVGLAKSLGRQVAFDPSQEIHYVYDPTTFRETFTSSDLFFGNQSEFQRALAYLEMREVREMLEYVKLLILTLGKEGSVIHTSERSWRIPCISSDKELDVTGAGDAYRGGFYAGLSRDLDLPLCGLLGASTASFSVEGEGPQSSLPRWEEAWERAAEHRDSVVEIPP